MNKYAVTVQRSNTKPKTLETFNDHQSAVSFIDEIALTKFYELGAESKGWDLWSTTSVNQLDHPKLSSWIYEIKEG